MKPLSMYVNGGTQNTNESFYSVIWARRSKVMFFGRTRECLDVARANIVFSNGDRGRLPVFNELGR